MKKDIHPKYFPNANVVCACGNTFTVGATKEFIEVEICSKCHPFYTGKEKIVDALGRVEKFRKRLAKKKMKKTTTRPRTGVPASRETLASRPHPPASGPLK